jgi:general L-amino acid transport system substrate-binding protein
VGFDFGDPYLFDGAGIMARAPVTDVDGLHEKMVGAQDGTTMLANLIELQRKLNEENDLPLGQDYFDIVTFAGFWGAPTAYVNGEIDAVTGDKTFLNFVRANWGDVETDNILVITMSKEPLSPMVREELDSQWLDVVRWVFNALVAAEELGVSQNNVEHLWATSDNRNIRLLLGAEDNLGERLGLDKQWAYRAIKAVGNYGEIYDRNLGPASSTHIPRAENRLWTDGGLMMAMPIR